MLKTAIWATCDRCGRDCSSIREKKYPEVDGMKKIEVEENIFNYWKISMTHHDCRFGEGNPMETILCSDCAQKFYTEFLKKD